MQIVVHAMIDVTNAESPANVSMRIPCALVLDDGNVNNYILTFELPVSPTNWKQEIATVLRAKALSDFGEACPPQGVMFCDFTRG